MESALHELEKKEIKNSFAIGFLMSAAPGDLNVLTIGMKVMTEYFWLRSLFLEYLALGSGRPSTTVRDFFGFGGHIFRTVAPHALKQNLWSFSKELLPKKNYSSQ